MGFARKLRFDAGWAVFRLAETMIRARGTAYAAGIGRAVGGLFWYLFGGRRRLSLRNAEIVLGDRPEPERRRAARAGVIENFSFLPEAINYAYFGAHRIERNVTVEGREHLDAALARGRGVVAPTVHIGNFALISVWMNRAGYRFHFLSRFPHDERLVRRLSFLRSRVGITLIRDLPPRTCVRDCLASLSRNEIICFQLDQRAVRSRAGVDVEFFGRTFHTYTGPVSMAIRTGAAIVPMYIVRERGVRHRLVIEPELAVERTGDRRRDVRVNVQRLMSRFEGWIRAYPGQWWWPNRRWR